MCMIHVFNHNMLYYKRLFISGNSTNPYQSLVLSCIVFFMLPQLKTDSHDNELSDKKLNNQQ